MRQPITKGAPIGLSLRIEFTFWPMYYWEIVIGYGTRYRLVFYDYQLDTLRLLSSVERDTMHHRHYRETFQWKHSCDVTFFIRPITARHYGRQQLHYHIRIPKTIEHRPLSQITHTINNSHSTSYRDYGGSILHHASNVNKANQLQVWTSRVLMTMMRIGYSKELY